MFEQLILCSEPICCEICHDSLRQRQTIQTVLIFVLQAHLGPGYTCPRTKARSTAVQSRSPVNQFPFRTLATVC